MSKRKKKRKLLRKNLPVIIIIILLLGGFYYYVHDIEKQETIEKQIYETTDPYYLLENKDTAKYIECILLNKEASILEISKVFYQQEMFWPYIFQANKIKGNILNLESGTILNIPKVGKELLDTTNTINTVNIKHLGDSLLEEVNRVKIKQLEENKLKGW